MKSRYPLVVIGAGPAGLAAAATAAAHGVDTVLLDEQRATGGQIYRNIDAVPAQRADLLGEEYRRGAGLVQAMRQSGARWQSETAVWSLDSRREIGVKHDGRAQLIGADRIIIATGAQERPVPFPGWTLPGVMNAGAGQILLKQSGLVPSDGVVLAGSGPLLLLLAWQYLRAGVQVRAVLDVQPLRNWMSALPHLPKALLARHYITKGLGYKRDLKAAGVLTLHGVQQLRAVGGEQVHAVEYIHRNKLHRVDTPLVLNHFGVIPQTHLSRAAGCAHSWDDAQQCWRPAIDTWGATDIDGISVAGDAAGIGGARTAEHAGRLAALDAARALGCFDKAQRDRLARQDLRWMKADLLIRPFIDALYRPPTQMLAHPADEDMLCRCEEITAGDVRRALGNGHRSPNEVKFHTRCGMGPCQGRQCADSVAQLIAAETGVRPESVQPYRVRTPLKPITIGEMAELESP
jgi:NADPH-dependent 2,4-dienoyl-CoA reductase/sulfur reductase-like enzyme